MYCQCACNVSTVNMVATIQSIMSCLSCVTQAGAYCAAYGAGGTLVAVGGAGGQWLVVDVTTHDVLIQCFDGTETIACISFSPSEYLCTLLNTRALDLVHVYQIHAQIHICFNTFLPLFFCLLIYVSLVISIC